MTSAPATGAAALVAHLEDLAEREDRGALAALRRGLGKESGTAPEMYRHVEPYMAGAGKPQADAAYTVASLFGLHPVPWKRPGDAPWNTSFGWSLICIRLRQDGPEQIGKEDEGVTRRFVATLSCGPEALPTHLRQLLSLLHSREEAALVDWECLFWDIIAWERVDRRVQRWWAEAFWRDSSHSAATGTDTPPPVDDPSVDDDS